MQKHEFIAKNRFIFHCFITKHSKTPSFFVKKIKNNIIQEKISNHPVKVQISIPIYIGIYESCHLISKQ